MVRRVHGRLVPAMTDLFTFAQEQEVAGIPIPWRNDATPMPGHEPCPAMDWPVSGDGWSVPGFDAYGAACLMCGLPPRAHWRAGYELDLSNPGTECFPYAEHRDNRWGGRDGKGGGDLLYRGACVCGWRGQRSRTREAIAFYEVAFHVCPGWLDLPVYGGQRNSESMKAREVRRAKLLEMYGPDPLIILSRFDMHDPERHNCRGVVPGYPAEICVDPGHRLDLLKGARR